MSRTLVIGVAGGSGSGKTTVVRRIMEALGAADATVLEHDRYYRDHPELRLEERALRDGRGVEAPEYDFTLHARKAQPTLLLPTAALIVEGILIFTDKALRDLMDVKVFVDTDQGARGEMN